MAPKFFVVDGHAHCYKAYYALRNLTSPEGQPVNMVYGFTAMLRKILRDYRPDLLAAAFDMAAPTFRHEIYSEYKANRKPPPDDFSRQMPLVYEVLEAFDIPVFQKEGYEADDILGTLARLAAEAGLETYLLTSDKDAQQLLGPRVFMLDPSKDKVLSAEKLLEQKGIRPDQVVDMMALSGDSSDNIPGIPKVGPQTALRLIREYGDLEGVLQAAPDMKKSKLRDNLIERAADARLSHRLATIKTDLDVELDLEACRVSEDDESALRPLYERLGFRQFLSDMDSAPTQEKKSYHLVDSPTALKKFVRTLAKQKRFSVDLETTSARPRDAEMVGLAFSWKEAEGYYLPVRGPEGAQVLDLEKTLESLREALERPDVGKVGQNLKYDALVFRTHGIHLQGIDFDTMIAAYVLEPERRHFGLNDLALSLLDYRCIPISDLIGKGRKQITMDQVPVERVCEYACEDADIAWRLTTALEKRIRDAGFEALYREIELPLVDVLVDMEMTGVKVDAEQLRAMSKWLGEQIEKLEKRIQAEAGSVFNVASTKQLAQVLFEDLGLPKLRRTKTGYSTDAEVLAQLADVHTVPGLVLEYRQLVKLKNTYVDALPEMILTATGKIHTSFSQVATATGRLSSSDPNLQNIPIRTELGNPIRRAFVPSEAGWLLMSADYSQIELRILAHLSGDEALVDAFRADADIHTFVASQVYGVPMETVTPEQRRAAKAVNFGIVYGLTPYGLSRDIGVPVKEAEGFINAYFERHAGVKAFIDKTLEDARERLYVETLRGRRRPVPDIHSSDPNRRSFAERIAVNTIVQGSAADMIKLAMIDLKSRMDKRQFKGRMILQIHDELLLELPPEEEVTLRSVLVNAMEGAMSLSVPVKVNVAVGENWLEAK